MRRRFAIAASAAMLVALFVATPAPASAHVPTMVSVDVSRPNPIVAPRIIGRMTVGSVVTTTLGKWPYRAIAWGREWYRVVDGTMILIGDGSRYRIKPADKGFEIVCKMTALNASLTKQGQALTKPRLAE